MNEQQTKIVELIAQGGLGVAAIFFAVLTVLFGSIVAIRSEAERRPLKFGVIVTYAFTVISLALTAVALFAMRYKDGFLYRLTVLGTIVTLVGVFVVASIIIFQACRR